MFCKKYQYALNDNDIRYTLLHAIQAISIEHIVFIFPFKYTLPLKITKKRWFITDIKPVILPQNRFYQRQHECCQFVIWQFIRFIIYSRHIIDSLVQNIDNKKASNFMH